MPKFISDDEMNRLEASQPKAKFISDDQMAQMEQAAEPGMMEALGRGTLQGGTLGFADELGGGAYALKDALTKGSISDIVKDYIKNRDEIRGNNAKAQAAHPWAYGGGELAGGVGTMLIPGAGVGNTLKGAAGLGALYGVGKSDADITDVPAIAGDALKGAAFGAAGYGAGKLIANAMPTSEGLGNFAENEAVKHLRPTPAVARDLGPEGLHAIGREALDSGAIGFGSKAETTAANLSDLLQEVGQVKGDIVEAAQGGVDPMLIADRVRKEVIAPLRQTAEGQTVASKIEQKLDTFLSQYAPSEGLTKPVWVGKAGEDIVEKTPGTWVSTYSPETTFHDPSGLSSGIVEQATPGKFTQMPGGSEVVGQGPGSLQKYGGGQPPHYDYLNPRPPDPMMTPQQLEAEKMAVQNNINWKGDPKAATGASMDYARILRQESENAISDAGFVPAKQSYGNLIDAKKMADRTAGLTDGGNGLIGHMYDLTAGNIAAEGLLHGNPAGLAVGGARALTKGRVHSALAVGADKASKFLSANPEIENVSQSVGGAIRGASPITGAEMPSYSLPKAAGQPYDDKGNIATKPSASIQKPGLDANLLSEKLSADPQTQKYAQVIQQAAEQGPDELAMKHFILAQTDPAYSKAVNQ
jgi:hypothetical protein